MKGSTSATSSKSKSASSKCKLPPSSAMITQLRVPSNLSYFRDLVNKRTVLDQRHMNLLENTPFHNFLRIPASLSNEQIALDCLIQKFNAANCSFMIGNKECVFGIDDIYRITGLPKEGTLIKMSGAVDAAKLRNRFMNFVEGNWKLGKLEHHEVVPVAAPQQGPTLDCGIFMIEFINSIVEKRPITITQAR